MYQMNEVADQAQAKTVSKVGIIYRGGAAFRDYFYEDLEQRFGIRPRVSIGYVGKHLASFALEDVPQVLEWLFDEQVNYEVVSGNPTDHMKEWFAPVVLH